MYWSLCTPEVVKQFPEHQNDIAVSVNLLVSSQRIEQIPHELTKRIVTVTSITDKKRRVQL